jgi:two-component system, NarL family, nitrate/nitrite response regulator NarL
VIEAGGDEMASLPQSLEFTQSIPDRAQRQAPMFVAPQEMRGTVENTMPAAVEVLIVDDHPIFRYGVRRLLEAEPGFKIVGEAGDGLQALTLARGLSPQLVILDLSLPDREGIEVLREISALDPQPLIVVLTVAIDKANIARVFQFGARGIVLKEAASELLLDCIRTVAKGGYWVDRETVSDLVQLLQRFLPRGAPSSRQNFGLSAREIEVVAAIAAGYSNREIAQKLSLSEQTVKHHITNIFDKVGVSNRMELVLFAVSHKLVDEI